MFDISFGILEHPSYTILDILEPDRPNFKNIPEPNSIKRHDWYSIELYFSLEYTEDHAFSTGRGSFSGANSN